MAGLSVPMSSSDLSMGAGGHQIINGQSYGMYSPEWYDAMRSAQVRTGKTAGQATGAFANAALQGIMPGGFGGTGTGTGTASSSASAAGGPGGSLSGAGPMPASVKGLDLADPTESNNAIFAKAKDSVGQQSRAAITSLNDELGAQGMIGGGAQVQGTKDIVSDAMGNEGQVSRDLASKNASSANDFAKTRYEGGITQRGQDIQAQEANAQLQLAREQAAQTNMYRMLQLATQGLSAGYSPSSNLY